MEKNRKNIMMISYIMFAYMGIAFLSQGSLKLEMAGSFGITTSKLQYLFTVFSTASMVTVIANKVFLERVPLRVEVILSSVFILVGTFFMILTKNINIFMVGLILSGLGIGIYISLGSYLIMNTFTEDRTGKLNFLHFSYSISAVITPIVAAALIGINLSWNMVYTILLILVIAVILLALKTNFDGVIHKKEDNENNRDSIKWDLKVYLSAWMLFLYVFTEMIFSYWIVEYMVNQGAHGGEAKVSLSIFWLFIAGGRLLTGKLGHKFKVNNIVITLLIVALTSYFTLMLVSGVWITYIFVGLLGLGFSSLYPSIIALGTEGRKNISPSLMTFIMTSGSVGGIIYSPISGWVNSNFDVAATVGIGVITTVLMLSISLYLKFKKYND
ncbi:MULTISPECIES: MFS transporter [Psychrilyobacter]|uniref:MFS transporter n=1 Tax=Psychrilyobacter piezotolerans TaxID=2293438 RepID=A0ABX9KDK5_9FUSO|nr:MULTISPECIES: MFS transporter [Psychrilyobacter]MCS5422184.1 MFS transporter [Psychrilyobacter sp. S5]NDI77688.1 MFS transporter [Psychrilyobacter piezotolerans]RDE59077.1 MFS transporter [Psychrilyobacter sp. S5]REI39649.1 MFS transporter [Psychrilyobacter piezotolerans]